MAILFVITFALFFGQVWTGTGGEYTNKSMAHGRWRQNVLEKGDKSFNKISAGMKNKLAKLKKNWTSILQPSNIWDTKSEGVQSKSNLTHKVCSDWICAPCCKFLWWSKSARVGTAFLCAFLSATLNMYCREYLSDISARLCTTYASGYKVHTLCLSTWNDLLVKSRI